MGKYIVVEVISRRVVSNVLCDTLEQACGRANEKLFAHIRDIGAEDAVAKAGYALSTDRWAFATEESKRAWCNLRELDWDAFIVKC